MIMTLDEILNTSLRGKVIAFPTDTVYGIGALLHDAKAIKSVYAIKKRETQKPLAILCGSIEDVKDLAENFDDFEPLANTHWPGALTLVVKKSNQVPCSVTRGLETVGLRIPADETAQRILKTFGPMAVTSLNLSGEPPIHTFEAAKTYKDRVDILVEGGDLDGMASTVYDTIHGVTLRKGNIVVK